MQILQPRRLLLLFAGGIALCLAIQVIDYLFDGTPFTLSWITLLLFPLLFVLLILSLGLLSRTLHRRLKPENGQLAARIVNGIGFAATVILINALEEFLPNREGLEPSDVVFALIGGVVMALVVTPEKREPVPSA